MYYYKDESGTESGPHSKTIMDAYEKEGKVGATTLVRTEEGEFKSWSEWCEELAKSSAAERGFWLALGMACLYVLLELVTLPYTVLRKTVKTLAQWGQAGELPSKESELPVLTFFLVALKPFAVLMVIPVGLIISLTMLSGAGFFAFLFGLIMTYFALAYVSLTFELLSIAVNAVNALIDIKNKI